MSIKITYTYIDYKGYPELTEISERRARLASHIEIILIATLLFSCAMMCGNGNDKVYGIIGIVLSILVGLWLFTGYQKRTQRLIAKAYARYKEDEIKRMAKRDWRKTWDSDELD